MDIYIVGWADYFPPFEYTNEDLCKIFDLPLEKAKKYEGLNGIKKRRMCLDHYNGGKQVIRDDQMAAEAAKRAMKIAGTSYKEIDMIISASQASDYITPGLAERVQSNIKTIDCHVFNLWGGCSEFINGLILSKVFLEQRLAETVLIIASDISNSFYKNFRYPLDLFGHGDAAGAMILTTQRSGPFRLGNHYYSNISRLENMFSIPLWGMKELCPLIIENEEIDPKLKEFSDVDVKYRRYRTRFKANFNYQLGMSATLRSVKNILKSKEDTFFILPQMELDFLKILAGELGINMNQVSTELIEHGYTGNVAQAVSFCESFDRLIKYKDVVMVAAGAGASFGSILLEKV